MIELSQKEWTRLYKEVAVVAQRMTFTKKDAQKYTARDRAQEALQRACERLLTNKPAELKTYEDVRDYLVAATRSELYNAGIRAGVRRGTEKLAVLDLLAPTGYAMPPAEQMHLEAAIKLEERSRTDRVLELTREELAGDRLALGTIDCLLDDKEKPAEQALILGCPVEQIYLARERRWRAMKKAVARYQAETKDRKEET